MEQQQEISCLVVWRGQKIIVEMNRSATFKELGEKLQQLTNVRADTLRLLVPIENSSKMLYPFSDEHSILRLDSTLVLKGKSVRMMGVPTDEVDEFLQNVKADLRIAGFDEEDKRLKQRIANRSYTLPKLPQGNYIFCDFQTLSLPGVELNPPASKALELLHTLASDPGIVAILNKHRWRVGVLTEMAPVGYVGISPKCILGLNKNHGEEISLRLRTDDLKGFRKYQSIKKTLLHELAHMVFSEHDSNFFALDSQLNKEAATLDWTKSRGHILNGGTNSRHYEEEFDNKSNMTSSRKLGGQAPVLPNARTASVTAAFDRLANTFSESNEPNTALPGFGMHMNQSVSELDTDDYEGEKGMVLEPYLESGDGASRKPYPNDSDKEDMQREIDSRESFSMSRAAEPDPDDSELQHIRDPVIVVCGRLQSAIQSLTYEVTTPSETGRVLEILIKIIRNVIEHPDDMKFKKLRKANPMIQSQIITCKAAMDILKLIGFCEDVVTDEWGKTEIYLILKRNDPGLLWLAKSSLETYIAY